ncbi:MAG TPA: hypothetical protein VN372_00925 [Methanospirillum sp.]|nr:hypothetical protein [Methanospirillum sp.]
MAHTSTKYRQPASELGAGGFGGNGRFISLIQRDTLQKRFIVRSPLLLFGPCRYSGLQE